MANRTIDPRNDNPRYIEPTEIWQFEASASVVRDTADRAFIRRLSNTYVNGKSNPELCAWVQAAREQVASWEGRTLK